MLKFFRKIRKGLLTENRIGKYLLYALGEIILVVIGILIALNLNNRNTQRKTEAKIESIFSDIMEELTSDIEKTTFIMRYYTRRDSMIYLVLNNKITAKDYENNKIPSFLTWNLTGWHSSLNLTNNGYNNLTAYFDAIPPKYNKALKDLNDLYSRHKKSVDIYDQGMGEMIEKNRDFQKRNYSWYAFRNETDRKNKLKYLLNDFRYINEVEEFRNKALNNHLRHSINYRLKAIECYKKIAKLLDKPTDHESFIFNEEIANMLVGEWQLVG
ncbi:MAG: hypothetical protein HKN52_10665, partial [Eudoraea sp.]|nr:hypothetical protein [Eudoraea sp.]